MERKKEKHTKGKRWDVWKSDNRYKEKGGRWRRSRWTRSTSLSNDTVGIYLQTQKYMKNTSGERTGVPDQWKKNIQNHTKLSRVKDLGGKNKNVSRTGSALNGWGN